MPDVDNLGCFPERSVEVEASRVEWVLFESVPAGVKKTEVEVEAEAE